MNDGATRPSLVESIRRLAADLVGLVHARLELASTELAEEVQRTAQILLWVIAALFFGALAVLMLAFTLVLAVAPEHRVPVAAACSAIFLLVSALGAILVRSRLRAWRAPLSATLEELRRDRDALLGRPDGPV